MTKDVCLKWADDSREVQSVAGGITVQKRSSLWTPNLFLPKWGSEGFISAKKYEKGGPLFDPQLEDT